jgi:hypothetical protein
MQVSWDVTPPSFLHDLLDPEDAGSTLLQNISNSQSVDAV